MNNSDFIIYTENIEKIRREEERQQRLLSPRKVFSVKSVPEVASTPEKKGTPCNNFQPSQFKPLTCSQCFCEKSQHAKVYKYQTKQAEPSTTMDKGPVSNVEEKPRPVC